MISERLNGWFTFDNPLSKKNWRDNFSPVFFKTNESASKLLLLYIPLMKIVTILANFSVWHCLVASIIKKLYHLRNQFDTPVV